MSKHEFAPPDELLLLFEEDAEEELPEDAELWEDPEDDWLPDELDAALEDDADEELRGGTPNEDDELPPGPLVQ